ncbi:hypothetical protein AX14_011752 [Amanita brunnescens Koide BX004]|nr:hypothetical protein AX14_011752 [Amanita brunnescens Koide BX004]
MVISNVCPSPEVIYLGPATSDDDVYLGPSGDFANNCTCNSVCYSLLAACSACQNAGWIPWSSYSQNCSSIFLMQYPETIPNDTDIPHWAYLNVAVEGTFDLIAASRADTSDQN